MPDRSEFLLPGAQWFLSGRVVSLVRSAGDEAARLAAAKAVLAEPVRLGFARQCLTAMRPNSGAQLHPDDFEAATWESLRTGLVQRVRDAATAGMLLTESDLGGLLWEWKEVDGEIPTSRWAKDALETPHSLEAILGAFAGTSTPMGGGEGTPSLSADSYGTLAKVVGAGVVEDAIRRRFGEELKPIEEWDPVATDLSTEELLARRFLALHQRKTDDLDASEEGEE